MFRNTALKASRRSFQLSSNARFASKSGFSLAARRPLAVVNGTRHYASEASKPGVVSYKNLVNSQTEKKKICSAQESTNNNVIVAAR